MGYTRRCEGCMAAMMVMAGVVPSVAGWIYVGFKSRKGESLNFGIQCVRPNTKHWIYYGIMYLHEGLICCWLQKNQHQLRWILSSKSMVVVNQSVDRVIAV